MILHVMGMDSSKYGGIERFNVELSKTLRKKGYKVRKFTLYIAIYSDGSLDIDSYTGGCYNCAIRPALWINLGS